MFRKYVERNLRELIEERDIKIGELNKTIEFVQKEKELYAEEKLNKLRKEMQKSLTESDIIREKLESENKIFKMIFEKLVVNINKK